MQSDAILGVGARTYGHGEGSANGRTQGCVNRSSQNIKHWTVELLLVDVEHDRILRCTNNSVQLRTTDLRYDLHATLVVVRVWFCT